MALWFSPGDYLPVNGSLNSHQRSTMLHFPRSSISYFLLLASALLAGLLGGYMFASPPHAPELCTLPLPTQPAQNDHSYSKISHLQNASSPDPLPPVGDQMDLEALHSLVATTRGYYTRDYNMELGWNNMRYIIETAIYHGSLLNRTVVIPSYVYARSCEFENRVCAAYAPMVNRNDALHSEEWRELPDEEQMGWRVPMSTMLNLTHLRRFQPVITVAEYLRLHDLPEDLEASNGQWDTEKYHQNPSIYDTRNVPPTLHVIENWWYDPEGLNRVEKIPDDMKLRGHYDPLLGSPLQDERGGWPSPSKTDIYLALEHQLSGRLYSFDLDRARQTLRESGIQGITSDEGLTQVLNDNGWEVFYTFQGALGMEYVKNVVNPMKHVAPRDSIRGFVDDYDHFDEDVLHLKGGIHYQRKPASLLFTSTSARDDFARLVLYQLHHPDNVVELAAAMARRMSDLVDGRLWMGAHMRRGDFVRYHWAMQEEFGDHLQRIKDHLERGRNTLQSIPRESLRTYAVPDVVVNPQYMQHPLPNKGDSIYIATDERDPGNLAYLREHGVVRAPDLITMEDRRRFGWPLLITDVLGIVEQELLSRSSFFYAHALSSVGGGVINIRAAEGADPRTAEVD